MNRRLRSASEGTIGQPMTVIFDDDLHDPASIGAILAQIIEAKLEKQEKAIQSSFKPGNVPLVHSQVSTCSCSCPDVAVSTRYIKYMIISCCKSLAIDTVNLLSVVGPSS